MKKCSLSMVLVSMFVVFSTAGSAFALVSINSYNESAVPTLTGITSMRGAESSIYNWTLTNPGRSFETATLTLSGSTPNPSAFTFATITSGNIYHLYDGVLTFAGGTETLSLGTHGLSALNTYISNNPTSSPLAFSLTTYSFPVTPTISNATLTGTVAPEPATVALVAAGLVGLPFARRLKKTLQA